MSRLPTISAFYGILIRMFFNDRAPPHFHARYGEFEATIDLATAGIYVVYNILKLEEQWQAKCGCHNRKLVSACSLSQSNKPSTPTNGEVISPGKYPRTRIASRGCAIPFSIDPIAKNQTGNRANQ